MKTRMILAALLLMAFGTMKAQEKPIPTPDGDASKINTLVVNGIGSLYLQQGDKLMLNDYGHQGVRYRVEDSVLYLDGGRTPRGVTMPNLTYLLVKGTVGVRSKGQLKGENLSITKMGTGEVSLEVGYNNVYVQSTGTGDVILLGDCNVFCSETKSLGKVNVNHLNYKVLVERSGDSWNMAINIDDELTDPRRNFLNGLVNNATPFFEAESNRSWNLSGKGGDNKTNTPEMAQLNELMRDLGENLQMLSDSVDWEQFERDMEKWGESMEEWGREMEKWGNQFEKGFNYPFNESLPQKGKPEVRSVKVCGSGDVRIRQVPDGFSLKRDDEITANYERADGAVVLMGSSDYQVNIPQLESVQVTGSGDVIGQGTITGNDLTIYDLSSGDVRMSVDYDTIRVKMTGSGDVALSGRCKVLYADMYGSGDLKIQHLECDDFKVSVYGSGRVMTSKSGDAVTNSNNWKPIQREKGLLLNPHWQGFEAGLNMLIDPSSMDLYWGQLGSMEVRPLRSWYFGFNLADVGIAFDRKHRVGMFTGVGLGWNNYSWKNHVRMTVDDGELVNTLVPDDRVVKNSKFGVLYLQVPLMLEVRPTRRMYIDLGVTGGIRLAAWSRIKYADGSNEKNYQGYTTNLLKCDASLRVGGENLGFFVNYALVPLFNNGDAKKAHPLSVGFSIVF